MAIETNLVTKKSATRDVPADYQARYDALAAHLGRAYSLLPGWKSAMQNIELLPHLAGLEEPWVWESRQQWCNNGVTADGLAHLLASLQGMTSPQANEMRRSVTELPAFANCDTFIVGMGFRGVNDAVTNGWRARCAITDPRPVLSSLEGTPMDTALLELREQIRFRTMIGDSKDQRSILPYLIGSFVGCDDEYAWQVRDQFKDQYQRYVMESLAGVDSDRAQSLRRTYFERSPQMNWKYVLESLFGTTSKDSSELCRRILESFHEAAVFKNLGKVLAGRVDETSWEIRRSNLVVCREINWQEPSGTLFLADSLQTVDTDEAYAIKDEIVQAASLNLETICSLLK